jgi:hypothetical protein
MYDVLDTSEHVEGADVVMLSGSCNTKKEHQYFSNKIW